MLRIRDISVPAAHDVSMLYYLAAKQLRIPSNELSGLKIRKKSLDARKKDDIHYLYTVDVATRHSENRVLKQCRNPRVSLAKDPVYHIPRMQSDCRPVVVGFGPAGMFAALVLALAGLKPLVLERGCDAATRREKVETFWNTGKLDTECNVQFGEGGAGTFSDGKLNTGTKNDRAGWVLQELVNAGAGEEILYDAKPHIGTDVLLTVVQRVREKIVSLGGEVRFGAKVTALDTANGAVCGVRVNGTEKISCDRLILAIGHSARDTFEWLYAMGVPMEPKPFSMGVRIEHLQENIDRAQYGAGCDRSVLPPADYKLSVHLPDGSSAYTFCMCPGGCVVAAASEDGGVVTNGMSDHARDGSNANSAVLVTLRPEDFPDPSVLGGMYWQQQIEHAAFLAGGGDYKAPAQLVGDFLAGRESTCLGEVKPTYCPGVTLCDLNRVLPPQLTGVLKQAIPEFGKKLEGFDAADAVLTAPEARSSSPVRIVRGEDKQSAITGLFPCGEGAGYAGGIMSAAVDGMLCAEALMDTLRR